MTDLHRLFFGVYIVGLYLLLLTDKRGKLASILDEDKTPLLLEIFFLNISCLKDSLKVSYFLDSSFHNGK